jgi:hypothetical protein
MNELLLIVTAVLAANMLTAVFLLGMKRLWNVTDDHHAPMGAILCVVVPCGVVSLGFFLASQ